MAACLERQTIQETGVRKLENLQRRRDKIDEFMLTLLAVINSGLFYASVLSLQGQVLL